MAITQVRATDQIIRKLAPLINAAGKVGVGSSVHFGASEKTITAANSSNLATAITLSNDIKRIWEGSGQDPFPGHRKDPVAHVAADTTNSVSSTLFASDALLADVITWANAMKAAYTAHRSQSGVHSTNDGGNAIAASDASDQSSLDTLLNELKTDINLHMAAAPTGSAPIRLISP